jgi:hypothetical protein
MTTRRRAREPNAFDGFVPATTPEVVGGYQGPPPTIDSILWLRKLGQALMVMGVATNRRVREQGWERTGVLVLDLEYAKDDRGRRNYVSVPVPVEACRNHDTAWVLRQIMNHRGLTLAEAHLITGKILQETDLKHVH